MADIIIIKIDKAIKKNNLNFDNLLLHFIN